MRSTEDIAPLPKPVKIHYCLRPWREEAPDHWISASVLCYALVRASRQVGSAILPRDRLSHGLTIDLHTEVNMRSASWMLLVLTLVGTAGHSDNVDPSGFTRLQSP